MGICESRKNTTAKTGESQGGVRNGQPEEVTRNDSINISQSIVEEDIIEDFSESFIELPTNVSKILSNLICKIWVDTQGK